MTGVFSESALSEPGSGPECQPGAPDTRPDSRQETGAVATVSSGFPGVTEAGPECPNCGATMSRFPLIVYCGYCEFFIEAPGRRRPDAESFMGRHVATPEGVLIA